MKALKDHCPQWLGSYTGLTKTEQNITNHSLAIKPKLS